MNTKFDPLRLYFEAIRSIKPIPHQELKQLWEKSKTDKAAFDKVVEQNYKLVVPIAKRFMKKGIDFMDMLEEGNIGLIKAVEKFDPSKEIAFSTYAVYWIEQYIRKAVENQAKTIRIPSHIWDLLNRWMKTWTFLREKFNREPTVDEVATKLNLNKNQTDNLLSALSIFNGTTSLESPIEEDSGINLKDTIVDTDDKSPESITEVIRINADIGIALSYLPDREKEVIRMHFGIGGVSPMSMEAIGKILKVSRERVRQLELSALKKLKEILVRYDFIDHEEASKMLLDSRSGKDRRKKEIQPSLFADRRSEIERRV
ncbi:MAG: RNA polymerase sigma factor RpoD/SigA [Endomicrobium sp.]|jgi:RNA polymerase primary sigma factor|nr:RNA polymerase sigma factor RpoD/SigA [Endomicrobium sp.]